MPLRTHLLWLSWGPSLFCVLLCIGMICRYCCMGVYMHVHRPEVNSSCLPQSLYLTLWDKFSMNLELINSSKSADDWVLGICLPLPSFHGVLDLCCHVFLLHVSTWLFTWMLGIWAQTLTLVQQSHYWLRHLPRFQSCSRPQWLWQTMCKFC